MTPDSQVYTLWGISSSSLNPSSIDTQPVCLFPAPVCLPFDGVPCQAVSVTRKMLSSGVG